MKSETQSYVVKKGYLLGLYPGSTALAYGEALLYNIDALQLYSNSGNSYLYKLNICYNNTDQLHPFEIQGINGPTANVPECSGLADGAICVTVPATSFGYIEIPFYVSAREGIILSDDQVELFPNPTTNAFRITCTIPEELLNEFVVDVFDLQGKLMMHAATSQNKDIDVSNLPSDIYVVKISNREQSFTVTKKLIKIE
ncbi:MAG TPA: T9SS type A sorting domain-containing protein [Chitinophagales bacterium]|nr:T9SS type A sorting domain-containing protein [Chitinophagales bacterium]HNF70554.1 T9SS type A sorting domain-containing protein [Chitinophagales bacterium]HNO71981.1 T9SS type A sorting domain-containing protein [Bacteroidia bacterium]